jgi:hypothetical protein
MPSIGSSELQPGSGKGKIIGAILLLVVCVGGASYYAYSRTQSEITRQREATSKKIAAIPAKEMQDRTAAYMKVMASAATNPLPSSAEDVITKFWDAASKGDLDTMLRLCPGSMKTDFASFAKYPPSPAKSIGKGEPHPTAKGVTVYAVTMSYGKSPDRTIKMAVKQTPDGHYMIDGLNTVWK